MPVASPPATRFRFEDFEVDLRAGELRRHGLKVKLPEKPFQLLAALVEKPGEVVTREELRERLWPGDTFVEFDDNLNHAVKTLREALGDSAEEPRFVETLPKHGYRFIAPVEAVGRQPAAGAAGLSGWRRWRWLAALALLGVPGLLVALLALNLGGLRDRLLGQPTPGEITALAVLPLDNLSGDPAQEYFADGMTEALITELGKISALRVISRQSVMQYKGSDKPVAEIARELNVDAVVEGSAVHEGDRVRISAQLVQVAPERHLWAESYERDLSSVLALQSEMARAVAREVKATLTPEDEARLARHPPVDAEAYEAYLLGNYHWNRRGEDGLRRALVYFEQAVDADPEYGLAYAGLAKTYALLPIFSDTSTEEAYPPARSAAAKALELDDSIAGAHLSLAWMLFQEWDFVEAAKRFQRALELNPGSATAHSWYALYLSAMNPDDEEAISEAAFAVQLDPVSAVMRANYGGVLLAARRYPEAEVQYKKTEELEGGDFGSLGLGWVYELSGRYDDALAQYEKVIELEGRTPLYLTAVGAVYAEMGKREEAHAILRELDEMQKHTRVPPRFFAYIYAGLGEKDKAFEWLERAYQERSPTLVYLKHPDFDDFRDDARYEDLLRRMNFPE